MYPREAGGGSCNVSDLVFIGVHIHVPYYTKKNLYIYTPRVPVLGFVVFHQMSVESYMKISNNIILL